MYAEQTMPEAGSVLSGRGLNSTPRQSLTDSILTRLDRANNLAAETGASIRIVRDRLFGPEPEACDTARGEKIASNSAEAAILDRLESLLTSLQATAITADRLNGRV